MPSIEYHLQDLTKLHDIQLMRTSYKWANEWLFPLCTYYTRYTNLTTTAIIRTLSILDPLNEQCTYLMLEHFKHEDNPRIDCINNMIMVWWRLPLKREHLVKRQQWNNQNGLEKCSRHFENLEFRTYHKKNNEIYENSLYSQHNTLLWLLH